MCLRTHILCVSGCVRVWEGVTDTLGGSDKQKKKSFAITLFPFTVYGRFVRPLNGNNHDHVGLIDGFLGRT